MHLYDHSFLIATCWSACTTSPKCEICGAAFRGNGGSTISIEKDKEIAICPSCHGEIYHDGSRYTVDIMVVPVTESSFRKVMDQRKYIMPSRYRGKRKPKFIAFYRGADVGAITHIAKALRVISDVPRDKVKSLLEFQEGVTPLWVDKDRFDLYDIPDLFPLKYKIVRDGAPPIQNRIFKDFRKFAKARKLRELYETPKSRE